MNLHLLIIVVLSVKHISTKNSIKKLGVQEQKTEPTFQLGQKKAFLSCSIEPYDGKPLGQYSVTWLKGDMPLSDLKDSGRFTVSENYTLIIDKPTHDDAGLYVARFQNITQFPHNYNCNVGFLAEPFIEDFGRPMNYVVGQKLELRCHMKGYPALITWHKDSVNISLTQNYTRLQMKPLNGHENAHLLITNLDKTDSGVYTCQAESHLFNMTSSKSVIVRVTDLLAAKWPFIFLAAEVLVLCLILFLYEMYEKKKIPRRTRYQQVYRTTSKKQEQLGKAEP